MNHPTQSPNRTGKTFIAGLLAYILLTSQLAPMALAFNGSAVHTTPAKNAENTRPFDKVEAELTGNDRDNQFAPVPVPLTVSPTILAPSITATKVDAYPSAPAGAQPDEIITYSVTITNSGPDPATNVTLSDIVDVNTAIVGPPKSTPIGFDDAYGVIGNVRIQVPDGTSDLLANDRDPDTDTNAGLTITTLAGDNSAPFAGTSAQGGQVTATTGDGSFQYNPAPGFTGADTYTYTVTDSDGGTSNGIVTLTVTGLIWFVRAGAAAGGDGRLTGPFNCFFGTNCFDDSTLDDPGDNIFLYSGNYIGGQALLNNQRLIGEGATDTLASIGGFAVPSFSDSLPSTGGVSPIITTTVAATNGVPLGQGNLLRGFTVGNTTGAKISGTGFGTLTVGDNTSPDVILNGTGRALNLTTGTFAATSGFTSVTTTSSGTQGISLAGVAGAVSFGSTTVSGATSQGILIGTTTADINFGNTSVSGGTIGISLQNNSAGTRTFGTLSISNNSAVGLLHAVGGGNVNVTGATSIPAAAQTAPVGTGIDIQSLAVGTTVTFAATTVNKGNAGAGLNLGAAATPNAGNVTFNSLAITTANGSGLVGTGNTGQINVTTNTSSISSTNGPAINITKAAAPATPISLNFSTISSTNSGTNGINLGRVSGNMTITTTAVTNSTGIGIQVQNTSAGGTMDFGNTTANLSGGTGVFMNTNAGDITFGDLDISPDSGQRALQSTNSTGTITSTSGDITATSNVTFQIFGLSAASRTPLAMVLNNLDSTNSVGIGVDLNFVSGNLTVNDATLATNISNPTGIGIQVRNTAAAGTMNFGNTNVSSSGSTGVSLSTNGGGVAFADLDISPDSGQRALLSASSTGTITSTSGDVTATSNVTLQITGLSAASRTPLAMVLNNLDSTNSVGIGVDLNFVSGNLTVNDATLATNISNPVSIGIRVQNTAVGGTMNFGNTNVTQSGGTGVFLSTNGGGVAFADLDISPDPGQRAVQSTNSTGTITSTSGDVTATSNVTFQIFGLNAANRTPLNMVFNNLDSTDSIGIGVDLNFVSGNLTVNDATLATNISNPTSIGIRVQNTGAGGTMNFGNTNVSASGGTGVLLSTNGGGVAFADLDISPDSGQRALQSTNSTGTIASTSGDVTATSNVTFQIFGLNAANPTPLAMVLNNLDSTDSIGIGVDLNFVSGNLTVNDATLATNISNPTSIGIRVQNTGAGGTMNFGNTNVTQSGGIGVSLNANGGGVTFADLDISPDAAQRPFLATNNIGVITSTSGTITPQAGVIAVGITNAAGTVPLNMQLTSVSASGAANGIVLTNTSSSGSPGGFIVNGDGTDTTVGGNGTGGTIANAIGADNATAGNGVFLTNANGVTLRRMTINGTNQNHGIRGIGSSNVVLEFLTVAGSNGTSLAVDEGSVNFDNLLISAAITGCIISGGFEDNLNIVNTSGTLNRLTITNTTFGLNNSVSGNSSIFIEARNVGTTLNFTLQSSTIKGARVNWINASSNSSSTMNAIIGGATPALGNTFTNLAPDNNPGAVAGGNRVFLSSVGTLSFDVNNNTLRGSLGEAIRVQTTAAGALTGTGNGYVRNNTIGIQATANSGSSASSGIHIFGDGGSDLTAAVSNNQVFQYNSHGILFTFGNETNDGSVFNATVTGNTVNTPGNILSGFNGIHLNNGTVAATDNFTTCFDIGGTGLENNIVGSGNGAVSPANQQFRLQQRQSTTVGLNGYGGANNNNAAVVAFIQGRNIVTAGNGAASNTVPTGGGYMNTAGQCTQPSAPVTLRAGVTRPGDAFSQRGSPAASVVQTAASSSTDSITARPIISLAQGTQGTTNSPVTTEATATTVAKPVTLATVATRAPAPAVATNKPPQTAPLKPRDNPSATPPAIGPGGTSLTWNVGTLPAGRSVTITFTVQVNSPYSGPPQVSNQGSVSFGGGGGPVLTDDPSVAGASDPTVTPIALPPDVFIRDARVAEPTSGTTSMLFTVALSAPATQLTTIDYTTANGTAVEPGDYVAVAAGSTTFQVGEQIKVIPITVNSDVDTLEVDENFTVTISANPTIAVVVDPTATGTITSNNPAGTLLISELRTSGPGGAGDDFVEIYNNTDAPHTVPAGGYGLFKMGADCNAMPVLIGTIPATTIVPQRGHYLFVGSTYSLNAYAGGDATLTTEIESDFNVGLFSTVDPLQVSSANRLDAVGFGVNTGAVCDLLLEGTTLPPASGSTSEYGFAREFTLVSNDVPTPTDGNDNAADFTVISTTPSTPVGSNAAPRLGAAGPENLADPNLKKYSQVGAQPIDPFVPQSVAPNRERDTTPDPANNSTLGTLSSRRTFTNNTGAPITRLRFRIYDITTFPSPVGTADLRARTSTDVVVTITGGSILTALATTLESPPAQPSSGGLNSSLAAGTVTLGTPLANGASIHLNFLFGVQQGGSFRVFVFVEAVP